MHYNRLAYLLLRPLNQYYFSSIHYTLIHKIASKNTIFLGRFNLERQPLGRSSRPGYHYEGKPLPDANAMPDFVVMDVISILFNDILCLLSIILGTGGAYLEIAADC
jgi:hypothetical protein